MLFRLSAVRPEEHERAAVWYQRSTCHYSEVPAMLSVEKKTYADYAALDEGAPYQLIDGELVMSPSPSRSHQTVVLRFALAMQRFVGNDLGDVYVAPFDVRLSETDVYQPDILFVAHDRLDIVSEQEVNGAPDLVVEVLSPATGYYDLTKKKHVYEASGVQEYWIVDPIERTVEVLTTVEGTYETVQSARETGRVASRLLDGFGVDVEQLFAA